MLSKRTRTLTLFSIFLVPVLCSINIKIAQAQDKPNPKVDYVAKINKLAQAGRPESLNAAPYYEKAIELYVDQPEQLKTLDHRAWLSNISPKQQTLLKRWIQSNSDALTQLQVGTKMPYYWLERSSPDGPAVGILLVPELSKFRQFAYAVTWSAKLAAEKGSFDKAAANILTCYHLGLHMSGPKPLVEQLVGIAIRTKAVQTAFMILDRTKFDNSSMKSLQNQIEQLSTIESYIVDMRTEKLFLLDSIQRIFTDDSKGGGHIPKAELENVINVFGAFSASPSKDRQEQMRKWEKLERGQTSELVDRIFEYFDSVAREAPANFHNQGKNIGNILEEMTKENPFLSVLMPAFGRVWEMSFRGEAETDALITTLALLQYKADKYNYPNTLTELVSTGYLTKLPRDPYSDRTLVYKRVKDDFTLYSCGADFDDDGGAMSKWGEGEQGGDQVFWPLQ